jgi:hypothetical protein
MRMISTILCIGILAGCAREQKAGPTPQQVSDLRAAEAKVRPFTPGMSRDLTAQHLALRFRVSDGALLLEPGAGQVRNGTMPYHPGGGDYQVAYLNGAGRRIGGYRMEDPRWVRSCDTSVGGGVVRKPAAGTVVEILVPRDSTIATLELGVADSLARVDVREAVLRASPGMRPPKR